jgi:hypothetical protein
MGAPVVDSSEVEQDRRQRLSEFIAESDPNWEDQCKPGSFGCHELLDRTSLAADMVEQFVLSHPACLRNAEWFALAERAASALHELYQHVGADHLAADGPDHPRDD